MDRFRVTTFVLSLVLVGSPFAGAQDLNAALQDLWAARWDYRHDFVENNGPFQGDYDRLRENWAGPTGGQFDPRGVLLRARGEFADVVDATGSQEARQYLAESINEIMSGSLSNGNYLLIEALKARFPFVDPGDPQPSDPGRDASDDWALEANGSVDEELQEIDKALIEFGIGIKSATTIMDREDAGFDSISGTGILRAFDPDPEKDGPAFPGFPFFLPLIDGFRDPSHPDFPDQPPAEPRANPIRAELNLLTAIAERRAQASFEKGQKLFKNSGRRTGDARIEERRKAKEAMKVGHHSSYLLAAALGALQTSRQFGENKGPRLAVFTDQMRNFHERLDDPEFQPSADTTQFIPPTDVPISQYADRARNAVNLALGREAALRAEKRLNSDREREFIDILANENRLLLELTPLTGFTQDEITMTYNRLVTIDDRRAFRAELRRRVEAVLGEPYVPGFTPDLVCPGGTGISCLGEFGSQILSVLDAQFRVRQAFNTLQNIPRRMQIEQDRSSTVIRIIYSSTEAINATEEALAWASSFSVSLGKTFSIPPSFNASVSFNPLSSVVANLQKAQNTFRAHEQADIEGTNSTAAIRTILLDMDNSVIELERAKVQFDQENTRLGLLFAEVNKMIESYSEGVEARLGKQQVYFNNPEFRRWFNDASERADARREEAIVALFDLGRALSFWWTEEYANPIFNGVGQPGTSLIRFNSENFPDLNSVFTISAANLTGDFYLLLEEWDQKLRTFRSVPHEFTQLRTYSLRDDILFKDLADAGTSLNTRIRLFRDFVNASAYLGPGATSSTPPGLRLDFPITLENLDSRNDWNIRFGYLRLYPGNIEPGLQVQIEADAGFNPGEEDVILDISYFGVLSTTTFFSDVDPGSPLQVIKWEVPAPNSPFLERRSEFSETLAARINGRTRPGESYLGDVFNGKPIASSNWRITLDTAGRARNSDVDISKIRDIRILISETKGRPVDPLTEQAFVFPPINP